MPDATAEPRPLRTFVRWLLVPGAAALLVTLALVPRRGPSEPSRVTVTALEYARSRFPARNLVADAPEGEDRPMSWQAWLVETPDRLVLVDTGFVDPARARRMGMADFVPVATLLREELGRDPAEVTDVVLTHGHWDHVGGLVDFPHATVWIQGRELEWMRGRLARDEREESGGVSRSDLRVLTTHPKLRRVEGDVEVGPDLVLHAGGGHTPGTQWVEVRSSPPIVLTSDIAYVAENLERDVPPRLNDASAARASYARMRAVPGARIVPGHDPETTQGRITRLAPAPGLLGG